MAKIRIGVGEAEGRHSTVWTFFSSKNEVYATHRTSGGKEKISFHSSRICQRAFTCEHQRQQSMSDRVIQRWTRAETPPNGNDEAVAVLTVIFPEGHLSPNLPSTQKEAIWLQPPIPGHARILQLFFTREKEEDVQQLCMKVDHLLLYYHILPNRDAVAIRSWVSEFEDRDLIVEASLGETRDLVLPSLFEDGVERPVAFTTYAQPDEMCCFELSGYWVTAGEARRRFPAADTISRTKVLERDK